MDFSMVRILVLIFCSIVASHAQKDLQKKQAKLDSFNIYYQPEYADVFLDKDYYFSGDRIWYSIYLSNYANSINELSAIAYVEIKDRFDTVLVRQKIRCRDGRAHGDLLIPRKLSSGVYKMKVFTLWMMNAKGTGIYERMIPIVNLNNPVTSNNSEVKIDSIEEFFMEVNHKGDSIQVLLNVNKPANLILRDKISIYSDESILPATFSKMIFDRSLFSKDPIHAVLLDAENNIIYERVVKVGNKAGINIRTNRNTFKSNSKVELSLSLEDEYQNMLSGFVSVSVIPIFETQSLDSKWHAAFTQSVNSGVRIPKERFIYPLSKQSLSAINFWAPTDLTGYQINFSDAERKSMEASALWRKIQNGYHMDTFYKPELGINVPFEITYEVKNYAFIPIMEDFLKEVIPQVGVRKSDGEKILRIRNSENSSKIYFFKDAPLLLIDDFIASEEEVLSLNVTDVDRISVLWSTEKINSSAIFSLADNGILSIITKSGSFIGKKGKLLNDIYTPKKFLSYTHENSKDNLPNLFEPIFWNPELRVEGKTTINFNLSDVLGKLKIKIKGYTDLGDLVEKDLIIQVE
jgi:hypothetical protein